MTLRSWLANRWLVEHETSAEEITDFLSVVDRDLVDAKVAGVVGRRDDVADSVVLDDSGSQLPQR